MSDLSNVSCDSLMSSVAFKANSLANQLRNGSIDPNCLHKEIELMTKQLNACESANKVFWDYQISQKELSND